MSRAQVNRSENYSICEAARASGLTAKAIRYYEQIGLIPKARRRNSEATPHTGGDRIYNVRPGDARRLATHGEVGAVDIVAGRDLKAEDEGKDIALLGLAYAKKMGITLENFQPAEWVFVKDVLRDGEPGVVRVGTRTIGGRPFRVVGLFTSG